MGNCIQPLHRNNCLNSVSLSGTSAFKSNPSAGTSASMARTHSLFSDIATEASGELSPVGQLMESPMLRAFSFSDMKSATKNFKKDNLLGEGGFGRVYQGWVDEETLKPSRPGTGVAVAIKKLNPERGQGFDEWQSEVQFLGRLSHPNLVKLLGYCLEEKELLLVYEFMRRGSLENHLFRRYSAVQPLAWDTRVKIAIGAAKGLAFLHSLNKQIIYRDFKPSNILLDADFNAKISDFGLAKLGPAGDESHLSTRVYGSHGYAAPEYVSTGHLYVKSDVYGYGVVLLELMTGLRAVDSQRPAGQQVLVDWMRPILGNKRKLKRMMDRKMDGEYSNKAMMQLAQIAMKCVEDEPKARPSMAYVIDVLEHLDDV